MNVSDDRRAELMRIVDSAQRSAGVLAARERGDREGAGELLGTFEDDRTLAEGTLLLAELAVRLCVQATGQSVQDCLQELCLDMELAVRS